MSTHSALRATIRGPLVVGTVLAVLVASLFVAPALGLGGNPAAQAVPLPSLAGSLASGSYGNVTNTTFNGTVFGGVYYGNASYGFVVNETTTNVSANVSAVHYQETVGIYFHLEFCRPNCSAPVETANITYVASEVHDSWANLTDNATVTVYNGSSRFEGENRTGTPATAIGLINATTQSRSHDSEAMYVTVQSTSTNGTNATPPTPRTYSVVADATFASNSSVAFNPALGLYPTGNLTRGELWSSTAAYNLAGAWAAQWSINVSLPHISGTSTGGVHGSIGPLSSNVTLVGRSGSVWGHVDGDHAAIVRFGLNTRNLEMIGPYVVDGAGSARAWGQGWGGSWSSVVFASASASLGPTYLPVSFGGSVRDPMSGVTFSAAATDASGVSGFAQNGIAPQTENAHPMTASSAGTTAACLQTGSCSSGSTSSPSPSMFESATTAWIVVGVVVAAVAAGAIAVVLRRHP